MLNTSHKHTHTHRYTHMPFARKPLKQKGTSLAHWKARHRLNRQGERVLCQIVQMEKAMPTGSVAPPLSLLTCREKGWHWGTTENSLYLRPLLGARYSTSPFILTKRYSYDSAWWICKTEFSPSNLFNYVFPPLIAPSMHDKNINQTSQTFVSSLII